MAQNITIMGASYSDVPAVQLPKTGGGTARFDDASITTATASDVASGKIFLANDGTITTGTSSGGGGSSSWTKVCEKSYQVANFTTTNVTTLETWATGHTELWTSDKWVYVRVRDTAGKRTGYFYGTDTFFYNVAPVNGTTGTNTSTAIRYAIRRNNTPSYINTATTGPTGYGVYCDLVYKNGDLRIRARYNSSYTLTMDGTYKVEVYLLDPPSGLPIFE